MAGQLRFEPLQRTHRRRVPAAEQQRQQRHEQADAHAFEHHHEERAREHGGQPHSFAPQKRTQPLDDEGELFEVVEGAQPRLGYGIFRVERAPDDVVPNLHARTRPFALHPRTQLRDCGIPIRAGKQPRIVDEDKMVPDRVMDERGQFRSDGAVLLTACRGASHEVSVEPEKGRMIQLGEHLRQDRRAVPGKKTDVRVSGEAPAGSLVDPGRHFDRDDSIEMRAHRLDHFAGERAGLDERAEVAPVLIPQDRKLLDDVRRRQGTAADPPLDRDPVTGQGNERRRDGHASPPMPDAVNHRGLPAAFMITRMVRADTSASV